MSEGFVSQTHRVTGYLGRHQYLVRTMGSKCPKFVDTRWLSMAPAKQNGSTAAHGNILAEL